MLSKFVKDSALLFITLNTAGVFSYLFQIILGRTLSPIQYGLFNSLLSTIAIASFLVTCLHRVISRSMARLSVAESGQVKDLYLKGWQIVGAGVAINMILGWLGMPWFKNFLHLNSTIPIVLMLLTTCLVMAGSFNIAVLEGLQRFTALGIASNVTGMGRCLGGIVLVVIFGWGVNGAVFSLLLADIAVLAYGCWSLRDILKLTAKSLPTGFIDDGLRYAVPTFVMTGAILLLVNIDIVLVRHYCSPYEAGLYATAGVLGKIVFLLPNTLLMVLFPTVAKTVVLGSTDRRYFWMSLGMTGLILGGILLVFFYWGEEIILVLYGSQYSQATALLNIVATAMGIFAINSVIFTHSSARAEFEFLWPLVGGAVLMLVLAFFYHDSAMTVAKIFLLTMVFIFVGSILSGVFRRLRRPVSPA